MPLPQPVRVHCSKLKRENGKQKVRDVLDVLDVNASATFVEYYTTYEGAHYSHSLGCHLGDIADGYGNILDATLEARLHLALLRQYVCLWRMEDNGTLSIYDTVSDHVYITDIDAWVTDPQSERERPVATSFYEYLQRFFERVE